MNEPLDALKQRLAAHQQQAADLQHDVQLHTNDAVHEFQTRFADFVKVFEPDQLVSTLAAFRLNLDDMPAAERAEAVQLLLSSLDAQTSEQPSSRIGTSKPLSLPKLIEDAAMRLDHAATITEISKAISPTAKSPTTKQPFGGESATFSTDTVSPPKVVKTKTGAEVSALRQLKAEYELWREKYAQPLIDALLLEQKIQNASPEVKPAVSRRA